jgi:tetratricopeptide (TPR) repeat protein
MLRSVLVIFLFFAIGCVPDDSFNQDYALCQQLEIRELKRGDSQQCIACYRQLMDKYPKESKTYARLADLYISQHLCDSALLIINQGVAQDPVSFELLIQRSMIQRSSNKQGLHDDFPLLERLAKERGERDKQIDYYRDVAFLYGMLDSLPEARHYIRSLHLPADEEESIVAFLENALQGDISRPCAQ